MKVQELRQKRAKKIDEARAILDGAQDGVLTDEQKGKWDALIAEADQIKEQIERLERQQDLDKELEQVTPVETASTMADQGEKRTSVKVGRDRAREARKAHNVLRMLNGVATRNFDLQREAQKELAKEGYYGEEGEKRAAGDYYSTLVDADGAILLPTEVVREIEEIGAEYGVASRLATVFNHVVGTLKVPGATGDLNASAVAEGGEISSSMRAFQAVSLNPKKWALIIPWTYEINVEAGPQILADAQRAIARGFERAKDDAFINGNGTATYNSINGILSTNRTGVGVYTLPAGKTSFDDFSADDAFLVRRKLPAAIRGDGAYVFHPDMEPMLRTLKDGNGQYIFAYNADTGVATLGGRPVLYTEVLPDIGDDAVSTVFGLYGSFRYFKMAVGQGMSAEELREGSVKDADTGTSINLATQDMRALKVRQFFDMNANFNSAFVKITTAAA